ncbi:MAG: hypothetical protein R3A48_29380 [Polyangiales bacterium]
MLTVDHIASRMEWSVRTARRYVAAWSERQHDPRVPRVRSLRTGRRGRPRYVVDPASFERWLCPAAVAEAA